MRGTIPGTDLGARGTVRGIIPGTVPVGAGDPDGTAADITTGGRITAGAADTGVLTSRISCVGPIPTRRLREPATEWARVTAPRRRDRCGAAVPAAGATSACGAAVAAVRRAGAIIREVRRAVTAAAVTTTITTAIPAAIPTIAAEAITAEAAVRRPITVAGLLRAAVPAAGRAADRERPLREAATVTPEAGNG